MDAFVDILNQYARNELMILAPVLYILCRLLLARGVTPQRATRVALTLSLLLSFLYTFATVSLISVKTVLLTVFTSVTQGILCGGAGALAGILRSPHCQTRSCHTCEQTPPTDEETPP